MHKHTKRIMFLFIAGVFLFVFHAVQTALADTANNSSSTTSSTVQPPTAPAWVQVQMTDAGVDLSWAASQAGDFPLEHYTVEISQDNVTFAPIATLDSNTTKYVDPDGQVGSWYQVIASDNQTPSNDSDPTTPVQVPEQVTTQDVSTANTPEPTTSSSTSQTNNATSSTDNGTSPNEKNTSPSSNEQAGPNSNPNQTAGSPSSVDNVISQLDISAALDTPAEQPIPVNDTIINIEPTHPVADPVVEDTAVSEVYKGMTEAATNTVTDLPSLSSEVTEADAHATVQPPGARAKLLSSFSDSHAINLLNTVIQGKKELIEPLLTRYNFEKTTVITLHDRLSSDDINQVKSRCQKQADILNTSLFNLPNDVAYLDIQALANCQVIGNL